VTDADASFKVTAQELRARGADGKKVSGN